MKATEVNDDALQPGGSLARILNNDKKHWPKTVTSPGVTCQLCRQESGEIIISQIKAFIIFDFNLCVKHFSLFHMIRILVEDKQKLASWEKYHLYKGRNTNNQNWKGNNNKCGKIYVWCWGSEVDGGSCAAVAAGRDRNYGIGLVGGYVAVGDRMCDQHQNILKLMSCY